MVPTILTWLRYGKVIANFVNVIISMVDRWTGSVEFLIVLLLHVKTQSDVLGSAVRFVWVITTFKICTHFIGFLSIVILYVSVFYAPYTWQSLCVSGYFVACEPTIDVLGTAALSTEHIGNDLLNLCLRGRGIFFVFFPPVATFYKIILINIKEAENR